MARRVFKNVSQARKLNKTRLDDIVASCQTKILNSRYLLLERQKVKFDTIRESIYLSLSLFRARTNAHILHDTISRIFAQNQYRLDGDTIRYPTFRVVSNTLLRENSEFLKKEKKSFFSTYPFPNFDPILHGFKFKSKKRSIFRYSKVFDFSRSRL